MAGITNVSTDAKDSKSKWTHLCIAADYLAHRHAGLKFMGM